MKDLVPNASKFCSLHCTNVDYVVHPLLRHLLLRTSEWNVKNIYENKKKLLFFNHLNLVSVFVETEGIGQMRTPEKVQTSFLVFTTSAGVIVYINWPRERPNTERQCWQYQLPTLWPFTWWVAVHLPPLSERMHVLKILYTGEILLQLCSHSDM